MRIDKLKAGAVSDSTPSEPTFLTENQLRQASAGLARFACILDSDPFLPDAPAFHLGYPPAV